MQGREACRPALLVLLVVVVARPLLARRVLAAAALVLVLVRAGGREVSQVEALRVPSVDHLLVAVPAQELVHGRLRVVLDVVHRFRFHSNRRCRSRRRRRLRRRTAVLGASLGRR